jgi:hypothetical protein
MAFLERRRRLGLAGDPLGYWEKRSLKGLEEVDSLNIDRGVLRAKRCLSSISSNAEKLFERCYAGSRSGRGDVRTSRPTRERP